MINRMLSKRLLGVLSLDLKFLSATDMESIKNEKQNQNDEQVKRFDINYMHRPPRIIPNYGRKSKVSLVPKSNVPRVLLYDNLTQDQLLDVKLSHIRLEKSRINKVLATQKKTFLVRRLKKTKQVRDSLERLTRLHADLKNHIDSTRKSKPTQSDDNQLTVHPNTRFMQRPTQRISAGGRPETFNDMGNLNLPSLTADHGTPTKETRVLTSALKAFSLKGPWFSEGKPRKSKRNSVTGDSRFMELESLLSKTDHSLGYLELSPTFKRKYAPIPKHLVEMGGSQKDSTVESYKDVDDEGAYSIDSHILSSELDG